MLTPVSSNRHPAEVTGAEAPEPAPEGAGPKPGLAEQIAAQMDEADLLDKYPGAGGE